MSVKEAAERLGVSESLTYRLIEQKLLGCTRIGQRGRRGKIVIDERDVEAFRESCRVAAEA